MDNRNRFLVSLETESFALVQTRAAHFEPLYQVASNPAVWEQHPEKDRWQRAVFSDFFRTGLTNDLGCFTVIDKSSETVIGSTRFYAYDHAGRCVRLGYTFLSPEYWGTDANREIKQVLLDHAFHTVDTVFFDIGVDNVRSRKATEKLGAVEFDTSDGKVVYVLHKKSFSGRR